MPKVPDWKCPLKLIQSEGYISDAGGAIIAHVPNNEDGKRIVAQLNDDKKARALAGELVTIARGLCAGIRGIVSAWEGGNLAAAVNLARAEAEDAAPVLRNAKRRTDSALQVLQELRNQLPAMEDPDEPQNGGDAVEVIGGLWDRIKGLTRGPTS